MLKCSIIYLILDQCLPNNLQTTVFFFYTIMILSKTNWSRLWPGVVEDPIFSFLSRQTQPRTIPSDVTESVRGWRKHVNSLQFVCGPRGEKFGSSWSFCSRRSGYHIPHQTQRETHLRLEGETYKFDHVRRKDYQLRHRLHWPSTLYTSSQ